MTCKDIEALFSEYYDSEAFEEDTLPEATRAAIAAHLAACAPCAAAYARYGALLDEIWDLPDVETPPGFHQRLMQYVTDHASAQRAGRRKTIFRRANTWVAMAATLAAVFLWGLFIFNPPEAPNAEGNGYISIMPFDMEMLPQARGVMEPEGFEAPVDAEHEQSWDTVLVFAVITSAGAVCLWVVVLLASRIAVTIRKKD
ncbi:MAG: zf-HC2 domain-containing protein [Defluviitaleaceae bacterium]|nr:zf-HC2 domain-containing protein [Defluviitaleaceae bacterium]